MANGETKERRGSRKARPGYRMRQFLLALGKDPQALQDEGQLVNTVLPEAASALFRAMPAYDRRHGLRVARTLQGGGQAENELLAAALLHDVGKSVGRPGRLRLWHRVAVVVIQGLQPGLLKRIGQAGSVGWRRPFYVQQHHAALGAELARQAGCSDRTVEWIRRHEDLEGAEGDQLLAALQAADNEN